MKREATMNWFERIAAARKRGKFSDMDCKDAGNWVTCACGEQDKSLMKIDRAGKTHYPDDAELRNLGGYFQDMVLGDSFDNASKVLAAIQDRAATILGLTDQETAS